MRNTIVYLLLAFFLGSCFSSQTALNSGTNQDKRLEITNDDVTYEIRILDPGYNAFLIGVARPMDFYSDTYYKLRNELYVNEWNLRVNNPTIRNADIFSQTIDYDASIDYGLELNYKLFNYFQFVEYKYGVNFNVPAAAF